MGGHRRRAAAPPRRVMRSWSRCAPTRLVRARRDRAGSGVKCPRDPEAQVEISTIGGPPIAERGAEPPCPCTVDPGTTAGYTENCISTFRPGAAICGWRSAITVMPGLLDQFPDIAVHVIKTEGIRWKLSHWGRMVHLSRPSALPPRSVP